MNVQQGYATPTLCHTHCFVSKIHILATKEALTDNLTSLAYLRYSWTEILSQVSRCL